MELKIQKKYLNLFIWLFFILNIVNTYFLTNQILNRYISPVSRTFTGEFTAIVGNLSVLLIIYVIGFSIFKKDKNIMKYLLFVTLVFNFLIFALGVFNLYYGTAFSTNALDIFKNPAEGMAKGLFSEIFGELFGYYRILVFVPIIVLSFIYFKYKKNMKVTSNHNLLKRNISIYFLGYFGFVVLFFAATVSFANQLRKDDFSVGGLMSTKATQNYGVYPFYILDVLGVDFNYTNEKVLKVENDNELYTAYDKYNKNKENYINILDGKEYSNNLLVKDSLVTKESYELLGLNESDSLNGVFKDKNLVLVHLESLNYLLWQLPEIKDRFVFLNQLFNESFVFNNYYTSVGLGVSSDAEASVLTGLYMNGYSTFYRDFDLKKFEVDTLPKLYAKKDYRSVGMHGDYEIFYNRNIAYKDMLGFTGLNDDNYYYSLEDFAKNDLRESAPYVNGNTYKSEYELANEYAKWLTENGKEYDGVKMISPWPSEFELAELTYKMSKSSITKHMIFSIYMTPHTPFEYNPYIDEVEYDTINGFSYKSLKPITKKYVDFATYIDKSIESFFIDPNTNESRILEDNVYVFYSDHGSSLKNGDITSLFTETYGRKIDLLEERQKLQQTIAFIYAPSEIKQENGINKGLLVGEQNLTRGHVDLYRTIGDLFGLFDESNFYFGVNGLSYEPTYVIDNRIQDLVLDNVNAIIDENYIPYFLSLRNIKNRYPKDAAINLKIITEIKEFKRLSDLLISNGDTYKRLKSIYKK